MALVERTQFFVFVAGADCSTVFASRLISLIVNDNSGETADTCQIILDDTNGSIDLPQQGAKIVIALGQLDGVVGQVFDGIVDDVNSQGDRGGGLKLKIDGKSAETKGKSKERRTKHHDKKTVGDALKDAALFADVDIEVAPRIAAIEREYQSQDNESFLHFAQRNAREYGGTFKCIGGNRAVMLDRNAGQTCGGGSVGTIIAMRPGNLITWNISPILTRPRYSKIRARWYDTKAAKWKEEDVEIPDADADGAGDNRHSREDAAHSKDAATGGSKEADRQKGAGSALIDGDPLARAEGTCVVVGARGGIDGSYTIHVAKHDLERGKGYTTDLELRRPEGDAGKDQAARKAGGGSGSGSGGSGGSGSGGTPSLPPLYG